MWYLVAPEDSNNTDPSNLQSNIKSFIDNTNKTSVRLFLVAGGFFAEAYAEREGANSPAALFACGANYPSQERAILPAAREVPAPGAQRGAILYLCGE